VWRAELTAEEWKSLRILIQGSHMVRQGSLNVQFFARLLGEKGESPRIIYAEGRWEEAQALDLLSLYLMDTRVGAAIFDDPLILTHDLFAEIARARIKEMKFDP